jgi:hypothetical protein
VNGTSIRDAHIAEQNDAAIEGMIEDAKEALRENATEEKAHLELVRIIAKHIAANQREHGWFETVCKQADLTACLLIKAAKLQNELAAK